MKFKKNWRIKQLFHKDNFCRCDENWQLMKMKTFSKKKNKTANLKIKFKFKKTHLGFKP